MYLVHLQFCIQHFLFTINGMWFEILFFSGNICDKWPKLAIENSDKQEMQSLLTFLLVSVFQVC